ncbi:MAG: DUF3784 domain-containing protein [Oscillospiraceae bacterium]|jgi:hypothetical protein|nr:DUF3784 domain-containing protein [Oscillospiraceae bacterium]
MIFKAIILFIMAAMNLFFALIIGGLKAYDIIAGVNTATAAQKEKMNLPAIGKVISIGFGGTGGLCAVLGVLLLLGMPLGLEIGIAVFIIGLCATVLYAQKYDANNFDDNGRPIRRLRIINTCVISGCVLCIAFIAWLCIATASASAELCSLLP